MKEHLTQKAAEWFNDLDAWHSFMELVPLTGHITEHWLAEATRPLRKRIRDSQCPGWRIIAWDGYARDTWGFLEEFGKDSIGIGYGWAYHLCFGVASGSRVDRAALASVLGRGEYKPLVDAFGRHDPPGDDFREGHIFARHQYGDFRFGLKNDGNVIGHELAWCAGHRTESFVDQAAKKIEAFVADPEITELMRKLNREVGNF